MVTHVVAAILDMDGSARPHRLDKGVTIRACLAVGTEPKPAALKAGAKGTAGAGNKQQDLAKQFHGNNSANPFSSDSKAREKECRPEDRKDITPDRNTLLMDTTRWVFQFPNARGGVVPSSQGGVHSLHAGHMSSNAASLDCELASVWFRLPALAEASPVVAPAPHLYGELAKTQEGVQVRSPFMSRRCLNSSVP